MEITIHRGSKEIGGTCIQLSTDNTKILLDLGLPLSNESSKIDLSGVDIDAVLVSHPHQDHYGLINSIDSSVPVYIGEVGKNLIDATRTLIRKELHDNNFRYLRKNETFDVGDFKVTPHLVDHSAVDAYAFLIEVEGKRIFYSGDFRAHGRKSVLFDRMLKSPPEDIDLLFMEGTMMQRSNDDFPTESAVEDKIFETINNQENISFIISSSQNIDRIVSAYRACLRAKKILVIDFYTAWVLEQIKMVSKSVPAMDWDNIMVYADGRQYETVKNNPEFFGNFKNRVFKCRVHEKEMEEEPSKYLYFSKMSKFKTMEKHKKDKPVIVIYSQWMGYLKCSNEDYWGAEEIAAYPDDPQINFVYAHTSGHATLDDLKSFAKALKPKNLVPIHTEYGEEFKKHFDNVVELKDNIIFNLGG